MQFISLRFICFLLGALALYYVTPKQVRKYILLVTNILFYLSFGVQNLGILAGVIVISYALGKWICTKKESKRCLAAVAFSLLPLLFCKYQIVSIVEPIGISFFTFKVISYLVDTKRGNLTQQHGFLDYAVYVSFFPTITSGPIDRANEMLQQIDEKKKFREALFLEGFLYMLWGYFQKMILADRLALIVNQVYGNLERYQGFPVFAASILYTLQIYLDFAGYTYLAVGIAKLFGYQCMQNFKEPYFAVSIRDFWQRWHMSLSSWLRDYVYIPLGGNRKGKTRKQINLLITFFISGVWHGTGWNFVLWGLLHGGYQVIGSYTLPMRNRMKTALHIKGTRLEKGIQIMITFLLINFSWVLFRSNDGIMQAYAIFQHMCKPVNFSFWWMLEASITKVECIYMAAAMIAVCVVDVMKYRGKDIVGWYCKRNIVWRFLILYLGIGAVLIMGAYGPGYDAASFIYFQF